MKFLFRVKGAERNSSTGEAVIRNEEAHAASEKELVDMYKMMGEEVVEIVDRVMDNMDRDILDPAQQKALMDLKRTENALREGKINATVELKDGSNAPVNFTTVNQQPQQQQNIQQPPPVQIQPVVPQYKEYVDNGTKMRLNTKTFDLEKYVLDQLSDDEKENYMIAVDQEQPKMLGKKVNLYTYRWKKI